MNSSPVLSIDNDVELGVLGCEKIQINGTDVLTDITLGSNVGSSSLQILGTLSFLNCSGDVNIADGTLFVNSTLKRVGIGSTTPGTLVHVYDDGGTLLTLTSIQATLSSTIRLETNGSDWDIGAMATDAPTLSDSFYIYENSAYRFVINNSGKVGLGTHTPGYFLHTYDTASLANNNNIFFQMPNLTDTETQWIHFGKAITTNDSAAFGFEYSSGSSAQIHLGFTGNSVMVMEENGFVGVGTNSASSLLHIEGNGTKGFYHKNTVSNNGAYCEITNQAGTRFLFGADGNGFFGGSSKTADVALGNWSNGDMKLLTNASQRLRVSSDGGIIFVPLSSAPTAVEGMVYYNSTDNKLKVYDGTSWSNLH